MFKKLFCSTTVVLLFTLCNISFGVELQVDIGCSGGITQPGWLDEPGCRTNNDIGGTLIDFSVEVGFGPDSSACECRTESGATHELKWVHQTFIKQDGANPQPPNSDMVFTLSDLTPGAEYNLITYHDYWDAPANVIDSITVTGATNVTKPSSIVQSEAFIPGEFVFTAGSNDVVIRYSCLSGGQPYFNGFELYGGGTSMQFESASSGELETETSVDIPVTINGPNESETYSVNYAVIGGTAVGGGEDYTLDSGTLTFLPGSLIEFITINVNDDSEHEDDETVIIELSSPSGPGAVLGSVTQHTYTIVDPRPDVLFSRAGGSGMENVTPAHAPVRLTRPTRNTVTVNYTVIGGTATGGGVDYVLDPGTLIFNPNEVTKNIDIEIIADSTPQEPPETIIIELSSPSNALLGAQTDYTHTIVSQTIDLKVDFALPYCPPDTNIARPETAKPGWYHWASHRWYDMYSHDCVWEDGSGTKPTDLGINDTGIHAAVTLLREGDLGLKVSGLVMPALNGGCPTDAPIYEPICNSWLQAVDWPTPDSGLGSIQLALHDLPAGEYELYSYHNHFGCYRGTPVHCDCICNVVPPMPVIKAMSAKEASDLPHTGGSFGKLFPGYDPDALPEGVVSIEDAFNVQPQQVTTDAELVPSVIRFATDGSPVLVLYQGGCCEPDPVRDDRDGGRGILNAFRLVLAAPTGYVDKPSPADGTDDVPADVVLSWRAGPYAQWHDVYLGTDFNDVHNADTAVTLGVYEGNNVEVDYNNPYDVRASYDPPSLVEYGQTYYWRIDAVSDTNTWKGPVWNFTVLDPRATNPYPTNEDEDVPEAGVQLSWSPGYGASSHDLYLGTNLNDVSDATTSADVYVCNLPLATTSYDTGPLEVGRTYYWRVDEQDPCIYPYAWKGQLWQFTVKKWTGIDDFEPYVDDFDLILTWLDGAYVFNGSVIFLGKLTNTPADPVHGGEQSLGYLYDNTGMGWDVPYYSEAYREIDYPRNWSVLGADTLRLWFYGDPTNSATDADQMYLGVEDISGAVSYVEAQYGNMADMQVAEWHQWDVSLEDLSEAGLNIEDVNKLYIGFGNRSNPAVAGGTGIVYFDDIRLYLPESNYPPCWDYLTQCHGDCDNSGDVKGSDFLALKNSWYKVYGDPAYEPCADFDRNGEVKGSDFLILKNNWYQTVPPDCAQGDINGVYQ